METYMLASLIVLCGACIGVIWYAIWQLRQAEKHQDELMLEYLTSMAEARQWNRPDPEQNAQMRR